MPVNLLVTAERRRMFLTAVMGVDPDSFPATEEEAQALEATRVLQAKLQAEAQARAAADEAAVQARLLAPKSPQAAPNSGGGDRATSAVGGFRPGQPSRVADSALDFVWSFPGLVCLFVITFPNRVRPTLF